MTAPPAKSKLDFLREIAAKDPKNAFPRYGIAMELARLERLPESADAFRALARDDPAYVPTYFQAGKVLERLGGLEEAKDFYRRGVEAATRAGNAHARDELSAALSMLE